MSGQYIDAQSSLQAGQVVPADARLSGESRALWGRVRQSAHAAIAQNMNGLEAAATTARFDSAVDKLTEQNFSRMDSVSGSSALLAGQLRQVIEPVLAEADRAIPNGLRLFQIDDTVALGAKTFEVRREYSAGEAGVWGGTGTNIGTNTFGIDAQEFQIRNYVTSVVYDIFEQMNANFANIQLATKLVRIARDTLEMFANQMIWNGDSRYRINGVLNYPWLDKELSDVVMAGTPADSRTIITALNSWANRQFHVSKGVFGPSKLATSPRVADWISQTPMGTATSMRDRTIGEAWMAGSSRIKTIEPVWELEGILGADYDGMLFYRDDDRGIKNVMPGGGIQALPVHSTDLETRQIFWMAHGGVTMLEVGNMLLVVVKAVA